MKIYSASLKSKAKQLRSQGQTYREICNQLNINIPKGTLSYWLKGVLPPPSYQHKIRKSSLKNIKIAQAKNEKILKQRLNHLQNKNLYHLKHFDRHMAIITLSTLYWCEGAKYPSHNGIRFGSSDPNMIRVFLFLLRSSFPTDPKKFRQTLQCRADQNTDTLIKYWQNITKIPSYLHYSPRIDQRTINIPTRKQSYKGVCVIDYMDTNIQCELQFLGRYLGSEIAISQMINKLK